jgi:hypothetical protein
MPTRRAIQYPPPEPISLATCSFHAILSAVTRFGGYISSTNAKSPRITYRA